MLRRRAVAAATALLAFLSLSVSAAFAAANFQAEPLLLRLPADKLATSLNLGNRGNSAVTVQAEVVRWEQIDGEDRYEAEPALIVSPPIFSLAPGSTQVIRVGRLKKIEAPQREAAYRLRVAEVPSEDHLRGGAVATVMHLSFPVFVEPAGERSAPKLSLQPRVDAERALHVAVRNEGAVHGKLIQLAVEQDGQLLAERAFNFYVLTGAQRELSWKDALRDARPGPATLRVTYGTRRTEDFPITIGPGATAAR